MSRSVFIPSEILCVYVDRYRFHLKYCLPSFSHTLHPSSPITHLLHWTLNCFASAKFVYRKLYHNIISNDELGSSPPICPDPLPSPTSHKLFQIPPIFLSRTTCRYFGQTFRRHLVFHQFLWCAHMPTASCTKRMSRSSEARCFMLIAKQ